MADKEPQHGRPVDDDFLKSVGDDFPTEAEHDDIVAALESLCHPEPDEEQSWQELRARLDPATSPFGIGWLLWWLAWPLWLPSSYCLRGPCCAPATTLPWRWLRRLCPAGRRPPTLLPPRLWRSPP